MGFGFDLKVEGVGAGVWCGVVAGCLHLAEGWGRCGLE